MYIYFQSYVAMAYSLQATHAVQLEGEHIARELTTISSVEYAAVLVRRESAPGSVVVHGHGTDKDKPHVITGEGQGPVIIFLHRDQSCIVYGTPSIRLFSYI
jgi:hypothetical protein